MRCKTLLLISSLIVFRTAGALVYSSGLDFETTNTRLRGEELDNLPVLNDPTPEATPFAPVAAAVVPQTTIFAKPQNETPTPYQLKIFAPKARIDSALVYVVDEESLLNGHAHPIQGAQISFISPLVTRENFVTKANGIFRIPYPLSESLRVFVQAPGYAPGVGYATMGSTLIVPLYSEQRLSTLLKSLSLNIPGGTVALLTHVFDENGNGISDAKVKVEGAQNGETIYSGPFFGGIPGYFLPDFKKTDATGTFLLNGLSRSPKHITFENETTQLGFDIDLSGIPESMHFLSTAFRLEKSPAISTSVVDGNTFERPDCGIHALAHNYSQTFVPNEDGEMWVDLPFKNGLIDMNVDTECPEYLPTSFSQVFNTALFPPTVGLFTQKQILELLKPLHLSWATEDSLVLGHIYPEKVGMRSPKINAVRVRIFDAEANPVQNAHILYFDENNELSDTQKATDPHHENFLVLGLDPGEWHFVYSDAQTNEGIGIQVVTIHESKINPDGSHVGQVKQVDL